MKSLKYFNSYRTPLAVSNCAHGNGHNGYSTVMEVYDAVEDSSTAEELLANFKKLHLTVENLVIDRDTPSYTRLRCTDPFGNIHYFQASKEV